MTTERVLLRVREKLAKLHTYASTANKLYGEDISKDMYAEDLDFYSSLLILLGRIDKE